MGTRLQLLLAEPGRTMVRIVRRYLCTFDDLQVHLTHVTRLDEARRQLARTGFDAVLLDLALEDSPAHQTAEQLRSLTGDWPVIVLTESDDSELETACYSSGATDFVQKSRLSPIVLRRALVNAMNAQRALRLVRYEQLAQVALGRLDRVGQEPPLGPTDLAHLEQLYGEILDEAQSGERPSCRRFVREVVRLGLDTSHVASIHGQLVELRPQRIPSWFALAEVLSLLADAWREQARGIGC